MDTLVHREKPGLVNVIDELWTKQKIVINAAKHWRSEHEKKVTKSILEKKLLKKKRDPHTENEVSQLVSRQVPFDYLAKDWLEEQKVRSI